MKLVALRVGNRYGAGVQRVQRIAPEPAFAHGGFKPRLPLRRLAKQPYRGQQQVLKSKHMGHRAIHPGKLAHNRQGVLPVGPQPTVLGGNDQGEQTALPQGVALGFRGSPQLVTLDRGLGKLCRQGRGALKNVVTREGSLALLMVFHDPIAYLS